MFLQTVAEKDATGAIAEVYAKEKAGVGFVPEAARCFSTRPDMPALFDTFFDGIKANFSLSGREWCSHYLRRRNASALDLLLAGLFASHARARSIEGDAACDPAQFPHRRLVGQGRGDAGLCGEGDGRRRPGDAVRHRPAARIRLQARPGTSSTSPSAPRSAACSASWWTQPARCRSRPSRTATKRSATRWRWGGSSRATRTWTGRRTGRPGGARS